MLNVHTEALREPEIVIRTPENLELTYALSGAGSRATAYLADLLILTFSIQLAQNALVALLALPLPPQWIAGISAMLGFSIINSYFILFEWLSNGQTPGKRMLGIRVIRQEGYALGFIDVLLRNLMRFVDFLPAFYGVGMASLVLTTRCQRLGDLVAGTIVVQQQPLQAGDLAPPIPQVPETVLTLSPAEVASVPASVIDLAVEFFSEIDQLAPRYRQQLAFELAALALTQSGRQAPPGESAETYLAALIQQSARIQTSAL